MFENISAIGRPNCKFNPPIWISELIVVTPFGSPMMFKPPVVIIVFNLVPINISRGLYKITHSLVLNIIYSTILYFIIKRIPKKYKKVSIN